MFPNVTQNINILLQQLKNLECTSLAPFRDCVSVCLGRLMFKEEIIFDLENAHIFFYKNKMF
jgi:hypothetical protein